MEMFKISWNQSRRWRNKNKISSLKYKRRSIPHTLGEALPEISDKMEQEMLKENLGLKDYTND